MQTIRARSRTAMITSAGPMLETCPCHPPLSRRHFARDRRRRQSGREGRDLRHLPWRKGHPHRQGHAHDLGANGGLSLSPAPRLQERGEEARDDERRRSRFRKGGYPRRWLRTLPPSRGRTCSSRRRRRTSPARLIAANVSIACTGCHLDEWQGDGTVPRLAGQQREYMDKTIKEFRDRTRGNNPGMSDLMNAAARGRSRRRSAQYLAGLQISAGAAGGSR